MNDNASTPAIHRSVMLDGRPVGPDTPKPLYLVTVLGIIGRKDPLSVFNRRCIGFFYELAVAEYAIAINELDMQDSTYEYAVVEECVPGVYCAGSSLIRSWFQYNVEKAAFARCDTPEQYARTISFGIG